MTILQILENSRKNNSDGVLFRTVTGLAVLVKQEPTTAVFVKTFKNLFFIQHISRPLLLNLYTIVIYSSCSVFPALLVCKEKKGRRVDQFRFCILLNSVVYTETLVLFRLFCKTSLLKQLQFICSKIFFPS